MRIGVYGDSFTTSHFPAKHFAWYNLLAENLGGEVYNYEQEMSGISYGLGASSTFWSYKNFLKYHFKHDLNIFVASDALKYTKLVDLGDGILKPISGINSLEWYTNDPNLTYEGKDLLEKIKSWFLVMDEDYMITAQELILKDIESKGKTIILAADLQTAFIPERIKKSISEFGFWDMANLVYDSLDIPQHERSITVVEKHDKIAAHLTEEANKVLAELLYQYITDGTIMKLPSYIQHRHTYNYYFGN